MAYRQTYVQNSCWDQIENSFWDYTIFKIENGMSDKSWQKISSYLSIYIGEISTTRYLFYPYWIGQVMFRSSHFWFFVFCHFWRRSYKNRNSYIIFVYILQGKMKKMKENLANKVTKNQKTKIWDEPNIYVLVSI